MVAQAFAPGHLTAFFSVHYDEDPRRSGSRGAGITIEDGVTATVEAGSGMRLNDEPAEIEAVAEVVDRFDTALAVDIETDLPLGMGCGVSGAAALATALAADDLLGTGLSRDELISTAHVADVEAGTGLGDVVAQANGGATIRVEPGAPPFGALQGVATTGRVEYLPLGTIPTAEVLAGDTDVLTRLGDECVSRLVDAPSLEAMVDLGRSFATDIDLLDDELEAVLDQVSAEGGRACIGLLGRTVVALDRGLSKAGYDPIATGIHGEGASVVDHD